MSTSSLFSQLSSTIDDFAPLSYAEFLKVASTLPCPCLDCNFSMPEDVVLKTDHHQQQLDSAWFLLLSITDDPHVALQINGNNGSFTNTDDHAHQHTHANGQIIRAAGHAASHRSLVAASAGAGLLGFPASMYAANTAWVDQSIPDPKPKSYNVISKHDQRFKSYNPSFNDRVSHKNQPLGDADKNNIPQVDRPFPIKTSQLRKERIISNKEQHILNGNSAAGGVIDPNTGSETFMDENGDYVHRPRRPTNPRTNWDWTKTPVGSAFSKPKPFVRIPSAGPTNQQMHAMNGNNKKKLKMGPHPRPKATVRKSPPKKKSVPKVPKVISKEKRLAQKYATFLKSPSYTPPRLGSSGSNPTNIIHGYFRQSFNMSAPIFAVTNATTCIAVLNPVLFNQFITSTNYICPFTVSFTQDGTIKPTIAGVTGNFFIGAYSNDAALKTQVIGTGTIDTSCPLGRFLGGSITIECRCPMATTAPPFMFGGSLPAYPASTSATNTINTSSQLTNYTANSIRNLPNTVDLPGFQASAVYVPNNNNALQFNSTACAYVSTNPNQIVSAIPYVGFVNCPTSAVVTITVSSWFEVQQNVATIAGGVVVDTADYGGWALGPKLSTEDIFDNLPNIRPVSTKVLSMGAKASSAGAGSIAALMAMNEAETHPPPPTLQQQLDILKAQISHLTVKVNDDEDEKYYEFEHTPQLDKSPNYKNLSKSTLDLAMSIKKTLTPGSATHKTAVFASP